MSGKLFRKYQYDIALEKGVGPHLVAWVAALMVFFVTLALAANFFLSAVTKTWVTGLSGTLTVEIRPPAANEASGKSPSGEARETPNDSVNKILKLAREHPAVASAQLLDKKDVMRLVEPWLGRKMPGDIPLPALIDVKLAPEADAAKLQADIQALVPDAIVDSHAETLDGVRRLVGTARLFVLLLTGVIVALAVVSIAGIVRAKFSIHRQEVETLHLIGASDEYIARQFRHHTLRGTLKGALLGLACMIAALLGAGYATHTIDTALLPHLRLMPLQWLELILSPVIAGTLIAHLTAQGAVMKELEKLA